jgi:uncharacterized protein (DUF433 family)
MDPPAQPRAMQYLWTSVSHATRGLDDPTAAATAFHCAKTSVGGAARALQPERMPHGTLLAPMDTLARITHDPRVMGGRPCIRGLRVTVGTVVGLLAAGKSAEDILVAYPYLEPDDIRAALSYAAWRAEEVELPLSP